MSKTKHWTLDDIDWSVLKPALVTAELLSAVKTAALVEANSACLLYTSPSPRD